MTRAVVLFIVATLAGATAAGGQTIEATQEGDLAKRVGEPLVVAPDPIVKTEASTVPTRADDVYPDSGTCGNIVPERSMQQPPARVDARCREATSI